MPSVRVPQSGCFGLRLLLHPVCQQHRIRRVDPEEDVQDFRHLHPRFDPLLANQLMNRYLKNLCELAGFNKPITRTCYRAGQRVEETFPKYEMIGTHAGRRTFICFALSSGIPPQVVMKWTGHSDYQAMKPYIAIAEKTKADAMKLFDEELKK